MYTIKLSPDQELPVSYSNLIKCISDVGKLFKRGNFKYLLIYENDKLLKTLVNPKFRQVNEEYFLNGIFDHGFLLRNENNDLKFYVKD